MINLQKKQCFYLKIVIPVIFYVNDYDYSEINVSSENPNYYIHI